MTKVILYIFALMLSIWALESINLNGIFKKNRVLQARVVYFLFAIALSYTLVNFFYDFYIFK